MTTTYTQSKELLAMGFEPSTADATLRRWYHGKPTHNVSEDFSWQMQEQAKGKSGYICLNRYGAQMSTRGVASMLRELGEKAGVDRSKCHPHAFRHFFAKMYLKKTKDVVGLADLLGHGSVDTTRIYLQKSQEEQKREYNRTITW